MRSLLPIPSLLLLATPVLAQWPSDPGSDLSLVDGDGDEAQALVRSAPDGATWVSWYDSDPDGTPAFGYDVRVQRLSATGEGTLPAGGLTVADRGFSSTQSYGVSVDAGGALLLAFRDDRAVGTQITVTKVTPGGDQPWGPTGVQVTNTTQFVASPRVAACSDGQILVGWTQENTVHLQRLDADGNEVWPSALVVPAPPGSTFTLSDLVALDSGDAALSWIRQDGGFFGPRHLYTQKLSPAGAPLWAGAGVGLETSNSLQIGNFPALYSDGAGGVVAAWYGVGPLQCYAQRVLSDGSLGYGAGPVDLSTDTSRLRVSPSIAVDPSTGGAVAAWVETDLIQADRGVWAQRLAPDGSRLWGASGVVIEPLANEDAGQVNVQDRSSGARVVYSRGGFGNERLKGVELDDAGTATVGPLDLSSTPRSLDDVGLAEGPFGATLAVWHDDRFSATNSNDVFAKSWTPSGVLGQAPGSVAFGPEGNPLGLTTDVGAIGATLDAGLAGASATTLGALLFGSLAPVELPFGPAGVLLVDPGGEVLGFPFAAVPDPAWSLPIPPNPALAGLSLYLQGAAFEVDASFELSDGRIAILGF